MKNIPPPPPPPRRRRRKSRPVQSRRRLNRRRHRNGCTVTTTFTKSSRFHHLFFVWASPLLKDLHPKRDLFRLKNFIRKSSSSLPSKNHPLKRVIELFSIINERIKTTRERRNSKLEMFSLQAQSVSTVSALRNCRANSRVNRCDAFRSSRLMRGANFSFFFPLWEISLNAEQSEISLVALFLFLRFVRPQRSSRGPLSER